MQKQLPAFLHTIYKTIALYFTFPRYDNNCHEDEKKRTNHFGGKKMKKKLLSVMLVGALAISALTGCGSKDTTSNNNQADTTAEADTNTDSSDAASDFDTSEMINVQSREDGSGTRGAFIELFGIEEKDADGNKIDNTTEEANITNSTEVMLTSVAGDEYAIGYVSLGSLNDTVKALKIDGAEATAENIKAGTYKIARPFNIATKGDATGLAADFINYIMSDEGQKVIEDNGYISQGSNGAFTSDGSTGKIVVAGSSSVTPVMEKLIEAYKAINKDAEIELQESDSTTGMTAAMEGTCDIGMASRELKDSETEGGLTAQVIAMDGIAVVVNNSNPMDEMSSDNVKDLFTGAVTTWDEVAK